MAEQSVKVTIFKLADFCNHKIVIVAGLKCYLTNTSKINVLELVSESLTRIEAWIKCPEIWLILLWKFIVFPIWYCRHKCKEKAHPFIQFI